MLLQGPLGERSHFTSVFLHPARGWGSDTGPVETDTLARLAPVAASGGFIPLVDHGVPDDVPYADYVHYLKQRKRITERGL
jgi:hypothetical protein